MSDQLDLKIKSLIAEWVDDPPSVPEPPVVEQFDLSPSDRSMLRRAWVVAISAAVGVLVLIGGVAWLLRATATSEPAADPQPAPTPSVVDPPLSVPSDEPDPAPRTPATAPPSTNPPRAEAKEGPAPEMTAGTFPGPWQATAFTSADGLPDGGALDMTVGVDGTVYGVYVSERQRRLYRFDGTNWAPMGPPVPSLGADIEWMVPAPERGVLLGARCQVAHFDGQSWTHFTEARNGTSLPGRCTAQVGPDGTPWIFGYQIETGEPTLVEFVGGELVAHQSDIAPSAHPIAELRNTFDIAPDGTVWYGTPEGAWHFDGTNLTLHPLEAPEDCCPPAVAADALGRVWVQLGDDVYRYTVGEWTRFTAADGLPRFSEFGVSSIVTTADGSVWITNEEFVAAFDGLTWTVLTPQEARALAIPVSGLAVAVDSPDGSTWATYQYGGRWLHRFVDSGWEAVNLSATDWPVPLPEGVYWHRPDLFFRPLAVAPDGSVWMTMWQGIARIAADD